MGRSRQFGVNILVTVYYEESLGVQRGERFEHSELWQRVRSRDMTTSAHAVIKPLVDFNAVGIEVRFDE